MKQLQWLLLQVVAVQGKLYTHTHVYEETIVSENQLDKKKNVE